MAAPTTMSRWTPSIVVVLAVAVACGWIGPPTPVVVIALALAIGYAWSISPLRSATTKATGIDTGAHRRAATHREAVEVSEQDGSAVIYWRPGCGFCARLRYELRSIEPQPVWVDIWSDPEAAEFVRSVNNGNETVPTVVIGSGDEQTVWTNPPPEQVRLALQDTDGQQ